MIRWLRWLKEIVFRRRPSPLAQRILAAHILNATEGNP